MRIGLDATRILQPTGEGTYTREVLRALISQCPQDEFIVATPRHLPEIEKEYVTQVCYPEVDGILARLKYAVDMGKLTRKYRIDVFHNLTNYLVIGARCPVVTTIHDLATLKYPEVRPSRIQNWIYRYVFPTLLARSDRLIAISNSTAMDIQDHYSLGQRTRVVYNGIDHARFNTTRAIDDTCIARFGLPANYLLFVGYLTPKKNLEMVLHAMRRLVDEGTQVPLVLVGKRGEGSGAFFALADRLGLKSLLIETGFVTDDELTLIYRNAGALVFPSIYEGFGLPVLEAMACGVPVLASNSSSLPELVANAQSLCRPTDIECWVAGIRAAVTDPGVRIRAAADGPERAQSFAWEATARQLREIYAETVHECAGACA